MYLHLGCGVGLTAGPGVGFTGGCRVEPPGDGWAVGMRKLVGFGAGVGGLHTGVLQQASFGSTTRRQYDGTFRYSGHLSRNKTKTT